MVVRGGGCCVGRRRAVLLVGGRRLVRRDGRAEDVSCLGVHRVVRIFSRARHTFFV